MEDELKPGRSLYWLAAGIFFIGGALSFVMWTLGTRSYLRHEQSQIEALTRVPVSPDGRLLDLPASQHAVFIEHRGGQRPLDGIVEIVSASTGDRVAQFEPLVPWSYSREGRVGDVYSEFLVEQAGKFLVTARSLERESGQSKVAAVGPWRTKGSATFVIGAGMFLLGISLVSGSVLAAVTFLRRRSRRNSLEPPATGLSL